MKNLVGHLKNETLTIGPIVPSNVDRLSNAPLDFVAGDGGIILDLFKIRQRPYRYILLDQAKHNQLARIVNLTLDCNVQAVDSFANGCRRDLVAERGVSDGYSPCFLLRDHFLWLTPKV